MATKKAAKITKKAATRSPKAKPAAKGKIAKKAGKASK
jgi:hypothetical protein